MSALWAIITATDPDIRNRSLDSFCEHASTSDLIAEAGDLEARRHSSDSLYDRVRALFFLYAIHRFHLPMRPESATSRSHIPYAGVERLLNRRYEEAISIFLAAQSAHGLGDGISSALASAYRGLAFQTLADQVRRSVRSVRGNQWMFRTGHPSDYALRLRRELLPSALGQPAPILHEATPVRMDLSHSGWSDIFFLGMDLPEGARVLNVSINLALHDTQSPKPPVEAYLRVIDRPVIRLVSVDLDASVEIRELQEIFDFGRDYLGLLKAAVIASGIVPAGLEGSDQPLADLLRQLTQREGLGLEIVSHVNNIPKGSRLAVSTNLLASLISVCMRATGQAASLTGQLAEPERRLVAARAILGEWLGGSGGGWQDSGGVWPGIKLIEGVRAMEGDIEFGISRGRLLPNHRILSSDEVTLKTRQHLQDSLVLVHGGMAQDVGPILEMVTERYLLRSAKEWAARREAGEILDEIIDELRRGDVGAIGRATQRNFDGPLQEIIPWASNLYTETLIREVRAKFGSAFWGFWMLGGMSGGGMGFIFDPVRKPEAQNALGPMMREVSQRLAGGVPFAMQPVVYDFSINENGTFAELLSGESAVLPDGYYNLMLPALLRKEQRTLSVNERADLERFSFRCHAASGAQERTRTFLNRLLPQAQNGNDRAETLQSLLHQYGFDPLQHERIQTELRAGQIGLAQNRLPASVTIEDVAPDQVFDATRGSDAKLRKLGEEALASGSVAVVTLAGGAGSRWTHGAGVVKGLSPFCRLAGKHRTFLEVHLAKSRRTSRAYNSPVPHIVTTSYLTHDPTDKLLKLENNYGYTGPLYLSPSRSVGLRMIPMVRDLRFAWESVPQQILDAQAQKVRDSSRAALISWAQQCGEGSDYTDNLPLQCLHPVGHWYEVPNIFRNGVLRNLLEAQPNLRYLMVHNVDTVGADLDAQILGRHISTGATMTVEVMTRRIEDRGGGLASVDGRARLVEGLALPSEDTEFRLSYYNSNTCWLSIDALLGVFGLTRADLADERKVADAVRALSARVPTYITIKDVKKRWGEGQEDIFPVTQFEKLWVDMTALAQMNCDYVLVRRMRGQQLKEPAQLDGWLRDGSADYVTGLCDFPD
ncbi:UTP--glucose-1-phosphate uridylyltransferase [Occallatibacter savannae]|uniref:UTP--glucose-1-phosphate uridylyltransferase n=1 Tax=Occallatibacter savannae TaxID=1002691 RepID=UPI00194E0237|nr:UTP--glucose-1-phosphate uridylyltransferase [Occallatibacter savannae]